MGCSASGLDGDDNDYPGAGREEREAQDWNGGGDDFGDTVPEMDEEVLVAHVANDAAVRAAREKEWGVDVCDAYYQYMYAAETDEDDDWQPKRRSTAEPAGTDLEGRQNGTPVLDGSSSPGQASGRESRHTTAAPPTQTTQEQLQRLESHRREVARMQDLRYEREAVRPRVLEEIAKRMMGLQDDPRVVLQVLQVPCEGAPRPSDEQMLKALRKALIKFHPDRTGQTGTLSLAKEVEAEEVFKLLVRLRDEIREDMQQTQSQ